MSSIGKMVRENYLVGLIQRDLFFVVAPVDGVVAGVAGVGRGTLLVFVPGRGGVVVRLPEDFPERAPGMGGFPFVGGCPVVGAVLPGGLPVAAEGPATFFKTRNLGSKRTSPVLFPFLSVTTVSSM